jgi:predicted amidohydrolase
MVRYPAYKVAAAHVAPVFLDTDRSVEKACSVIEEAAGKGARLIAFPEAILPGFPVWAALDAPIRTHELFKRLAASAVAIDGPELARVRQAARRKGVFVSIGFTEGTTVSVGCLWNANVLIGADGAILNHHRKLVPTWYEKLIWAGGDGRGLRVSDTEMGRIGMLICGENTNPLARFALMAEGEQVHVSTYPPVWPTRPPEGPGNYDLAQAIRIRSGAHAFEAKVFNVVASSCVDQTLPLRHLCPFGRSFAAPSGGVYRRGAGLGRLRSDGRSSRVSVRLATTGMKGAPFSGGSTGRPPGYSATSSAPAPPADGRERARTDVQRSRPSPPVA